MVFHAESVKSITINVISKNLFKKDLEISLENW